MGIFKNRDPRKQNTLHNYNNKKMEIKDTFSYLTTNNSSVLLDVLFQIFVKAHIWKIARLTVLKYSFTEDSIKLCMQTLQLEDFTNSSKLDEISSL